MKSIVMFMLIVGIFFIMTCAVTEAEDSRHVNVGDNGVALQGYDPVSYFTGTPSVGKPQYTVAHGGIQYQFVGQKSLEQFKLAPEKYLPAYGGWCAWAMLDGGKVDVNPERFKIIDGINFLYYDGFWGNTLNKWKKLAEKESEAALVRQAGVHWQTIVSE